MPRFPLILTICLYLLIYLIRWQQGGWEIEINLFVNQRKVLDQKITQFLPSPQAELLSGIILGEKKNLPGELRVALRDSSTLHMVVVSGQNLTLLGGVILSLSGLLKKRMAIIISLLAVIFYTLLTGAQVPALRAAIMVILASTALVFGRQKDGVWILGVTGGLMLLINPKWILDLSFQLSFLATIGVVVVAPIFLKHLRSLPELLSQDLAITTAAQLMVIPIIAQNFHQLSVVGFLANILVGWTIPFIMIIGLAATLVGIFWQTGGEILGIFTNIFLTFFIYIAQFFASLPFSWQYVGEKIWIFWAGYYLVLGGILIALGKLETRSTKSETISNDKN